MCLIVGLGNPGNKYANTPHNIGFEVVNQLQENWRTVYNFSGWKLTQKFNSQISEGKINDKKIILAKPTTYMNGSGIAVKKLFDFYKTPYRDIIVIHDDADLPFGAIQESYGRGSAGHKGVESIITTLGTKNFTRIRIGIRPIGKELAPKSLEKFVLEKFTVSEKKEMEKIQKEAVSRIEKSILV